MGTETMTSTRTAPDAAKTVYCSFCGKTNHEVKKIIAGPHSMAICDECVDLCKQIVDDVTEVAIPIEISDDERYRLAALRVQCFQALNGFGTTLDGKFDKWDLVKQREKADDLAVWALESGPLLERISGKHTMKTVRTMVDGDLYPEPDPVRVMVDGDL